MHIILKRFKMKAMLNFEYYHIYSADAKLILRNLPSGELAAGSVTGG